MTLPDNESTPRTPLAQTEAALPAGAQSLGRTSADQTMSVSVIVRRKNPLTSEVATGRILSRGEFDQSYAADPKDFDRIRAFAAQHGLTVDEKASSLARRTLVLTGPVSAMETAFGVELEDYQGSGQTRYHCYKGQIRVPQEPADAIESVLGLDARPIARPHFRYVKSGAGVARPNAVTGSFTPVQVAKLYNFPTGVTGAGQSIALIELGGGYNDSDVQQYFGSLGLTPPTVVAVSVDGAANSPGDANGADGEVALDIQVAGGVAPGAKIAVYFAPNTDRGFTDAITTAVHDTENEPSVISISWGGPETSWTQAAMKSLDQACLSAAALGVTITVASGDNGSTDGTSSTTVDFPSSSPHVLACGGTELKASGTSIAGETVWNDQAAGGGATGGGVSAVFTRPDWQAGANVPAPKGTSGGRGVPDVAGDAAPDTGYQVLVDGQQSVVGGTSAVAPLWAGLIALVNQQRGRPVGFANALLYNSAKAFHDITQGNNGSFQAAAGWDACTGLGSPDGVAVAKALAAAG